MALIQATYTAHDKDPEFAGLLISHDYNISSPCRLKVDINVPEIPTLCVPVELSISKVHTTEDLCRIYILMSIEFGIKCT